VFAQINAHQFNKRKFQTRTQKAFLFSEEEEQSVS